MTISEALRYEAANRPQTNQPLTPEKDALAFEWTYSQYWAAVERINADWRREREQ